MTTRTAALEPLGSTKLQEAQVHIGRRRLLRLGLAATVAGLVRPGLSWAAPPVGLADALVLVWLKGGASQLETFDPKPGTLAGGPTRALDTRAPGLTLSEHFPALAERAAKLSLVRGLRTREGDHDRAATLVHTGFSQSMSVRYPALGAVVAAEGSAGADAVPSGLPPPARRGRDGEGVRYVVLGEARVADAGYLGSEHAPFRARGGAGGLAVAADLDAERRAARRALLSTLEAPFARATGLRAGSNGAPSARVSSCAAAERLLAGPLREALDVEREPAALSRYGDGEAGRGLLAARRLTTAGVRAVEVVVDGWDDHERIVERLPARARALDQALGALLDDLDGAGRLARTLVLVLGEFGRTPLLNPRGGRDHDPRVNAALVAGGGLRMGQVVGATTPDGLSPAQPVSIADLAATVLARFGIAPGATRQAGDRPVGVTDGGAPIVALLPG